MSASVELPVSRWFAGVYGRANAWVMSDRMARWRTQRGLWLLYGLSRLVMVLVPFGLFPYPGGSLIISDVELYSSWSQVLAAGHYPTSDPMWQYPPLAAFVFALGAHLTWNPAFGFILLALLADAAIFVLLLRAGRKSGNLDGAWTYAWAGAAIGPVLLARFDVFPTLFAVLALLLLAKPVRSGILIGFGALLKVWPLLLVIAHPRRALPKVAAAAVATGVAGMALLSLWGPGLMTFAQGQSDRGLQIESVGGGLYVIAHGLGIDIETVFRYGSMEINATGAGIIASLVTFAGLAAIGWVAFARLRGRLEHVCGADVALTLVLLSIASSRVFSPQYMVWLAGVAAVCMLDPRSRMRRVIWILLPTAILGQVVYPWLYGAMIDGQWLGVTAQVIRVALLLAATVLAMMRILRPATAGTQISEPTRRLSESL